MYERLNAGSIDTFEELQQHAPKTAAWVRAKIAFKGTAYVHAVHDLTKIKMRFLEARLEDGTKEEELRPKAMDFAAQMRKRLEAEGYDSIQETLAVLGDAEELLSTIFEDWEDQQAAKEDKGGNHVVH